MLDYLRDVGREVVLTHGFSSAEIGLSWWTRALQDHEPGTFAFTLDRGSDGLPRLTRGTIMALADEVLGADGGGADDDLRSLMWHVLAWGSGNSRRQNSRRIEALTGPDSKPRLQLLREAAQLARDGQPGPAYGMLIRRGGGVIPGLGPSFFTKFLYFAGAGEIDHRCVVLDARVARALHGVGWTDLPPRYMNWYTATYDSYCHLLARWAEELSGEVGRPVGLDELEWILFLASTYFGVGRGAERPEWPLKPKH